MNIIKPKHIDYYPNSISFSAGFLGPMGDVGYFMVADYQGAKSILLNLLELRDDIEYAEMGLDGDWDYNSTYIYRNGEHHEYDCYGESQWAEPIMIVYYKDGSNEAFSVWYKEDKKNN